MPGLYGIYTTKHVVPENNYCRMFDKGYADVQSEKRFNNFVYGRKVLDKFLDDRVLFETEDYIVGFEGLNYSRSQGGINYLQDLYNKKGIQFIEEIDGVFSGFIYNKASNLLQVFTDRLSTKPVYYYLNKEQRIFIFSSELKLVSSLLRDLNIPISYDHEGISCLLSLGYMLDDLTLVSGVKKLGHAKILEIDFHSWNFEETRYFTFRVSPQKISKKKAIDQLDYHLCNAVQNEWNKDREYGHKHFSFLSGGLDSRVNVLVANYLGYKTDMVLTFSQSNTGDHIIATEIANHYKFKHQFYPLDTGQYLAENINEYVESNDGLNMYKGAAHMYWALKRMNLDSFGMAHSGQIGGILFGSFNKKITNIVPIIQKQAYVKNPDLLNEICTNRNISDRYRDNLETFSYEQRQINGILNGDRMISHMIDLGSPFYDKDLLAFCLTLPDEYKASQYIYFQWFNKKHKYIANFKHDKSGIKPKNAFTTKAADKIIKLRNIFNPNKNRMNPFAKWYQENPSIRKALEYQYRQHIETVQNKEIQSLISYTYHLDGIEPKISAVTVLLALHLHFQKESKITPN